MSSGPAACWTCAERAATSGWTIALSALRRSSSAKTIAPSFGRSSEPSGASTSAPTSATTAASPSVPGSTTSRAIRSASTRTAPYEASSRATSLLPAPIPPVRPTVSMPASLLGGPPRPRCAGLAPSAAVVLAVGEEALELRREVVGRGQVDGPGDQALARLRPGDSVVLALQAAHHGHQFAVALGDLPVDLDPHGVRLVAQGVGDLGQHQACRGGDRLKDGQC